MGQFWPHGHVLKRLNSPLSIIFLKNKLHHDNHRTMHCMFLKYKISCHMHFNIRREIYKWKNINLNTGHIPGIKSADFIKIFKNKRQKLHSVVHRLQAIMLQWTMIICYA